MGRHIYQAEDESGASHIAADRAAKSALGVATPENMARRVLSLGLLLEDASLASRILNGTFSNMEHRSTDYDGIEITAVRLGAQVRISNRDGVTVVTDEEYLRLV